MSEPWLSGAHAEVDPVLRPILFSLEQAREDLRQWTQGISEEQLWATPLGLGRLVSNFGTLQVVLTGCLLTQKTGSLASNSFS